MFIQRKTVNHVADLNCFVDVGLTLAVHEGNRKCQLVLAVSSWVPLSMRLGMLLDSGTNRADKIAIITFGYKGKTSRRMRWISSVSPCFVS